MSEAASSPLLAAQGRCSGRWGTASRRQGIFKLVGGLQGCQRCGMLGSARTTRQPCVHGGSAASVPGSRAALPAERPCRRALCPMQHGCLSACPGTWPPVHAHLLAFWRTAVAGLRAQPGRVAGQAPCKAPPPCTLAGRPRRSGTPRGRSASSRWAWPSTAAPTAACWSTT